MRARNAETLTTLERAVEDREGWWTSARCVRATDDDSERSEHSKISCWFHADELGSTEYLLCHDRAAPNSRYPSWPTETNMVEGRISLIIHPSPISHSPDSSRKFSEFISAPQRLKPPHPIVHIHTKYTYIRLKKRVPLLLMIV